jgi:acetolactate synthase-1/2/3 large subunit
MGAQGYALPAAIGARIGSRRTVIALAGDAGSLASIGELASAVQAEAHVILMVWNNSGCAGLRDRIGRRMAEASLAALPAVDFQALARGLGAAYARVHGLSYFHEALQRAAWRPASTVIELREEFWFES